jgi:hypothetical protein
MAKDLVSVVFAQLLDNPVVFIVATANAEVHLSAFNYCTGPTDRFRFLAPATATYLMIHT